MSLSVKAVIQTSDHFQDVLAESATLVHAAVTGTGILQTVSTAITHPDVPRNITLTSVGANTGVSTITGLNSLGNAETEDLTINAGGVIAGNVAFAKVTSYTVPVALRGTFGRHTSGAAPSTDISALGAGAKLQILNDAELAYTEVTIDATALDTGAGIAEALQIAVRAISAAYDNVIFFWDSDHDYYIVTSETSGSTSKVRFKDGTSNNIAAALKLGSGADAGTNNGGTDTDGIDDTLSCGIGSKIGLSNRVESVHKVKKGNADYPVASYTTNTTYNTIDFSTGGAISGGDDFTVWYRLL